MLRHSEFPNDHWSVITAHELTYIHALLLHLGDSLYIYFCSSLLWVWTNLCSHFATHTLEQLKLVFTLCHSYTQATWTHVHTLPFVRLSDLLYVDSWIYIHILLFHLGDSLYIYLRSSLLCGRFMFTLCHSYARVTQTHVHALPFVRLSNSFYVHALPFICLSDSFYVHALPFVCLRNSFLCTDPPIQIIYVTHHVADG